MLAEAPHRISASLIFPQDQGHELPFGEIGMISLYVFTGRVHPKVQGLVHSEFHR
jgi:hypothetical protein